MRARAFGAASPARIGALHPPKGAPEQQGQGSRGEGRVVMRARVSRRTESSGSQLMTSNPHNHSSAQLLVFVSNGCWPSSSQAVAVGLAFALTFLLAWSLRPSKNAARCSVMLRGHLQGPQGVNPQDRLPGGAERTQSFKAASQRSASRAARQPEPAAVIA